MDDGTKQRSATSLGVHNERVALTKHSIEPWQDADAKAAPKILHADDNVWLLQVHRVDLPCNTSACGDMRVDDVPSSQVHLFVSVLACGRV